MPLSGRRCARRLLPGAHRGGARPRGGLGLGTSAVRLDPLERRRPESRHGADRPRSGAPLLLRLGRLPGGRLRAGLAAAGRMEAAPAVDRPERPRDRRPRAQALRLRPLRRLRHRQRRDAPWPRDGRRVVRPDDRRPLIAGRRGTRGTALRTGRGCPRRTGRGYDRREESRRSWSGAQESQGRPAGADGSWRLG